MRISVLPKKMPETSKPQGAGRSNNKPQGTGRSTSKPQGASPRDEVPANAAAGHRACARCFAGGGHCPPGGRAYESDRRVAKKPEARMARVS